MSSSFGFREVTGYMGRRAPLLLLRKIIEIAFGLVTLAVLARTLSQQEYAIYSLLFSYVAIARLTALPGLGQAVTQSFARGARGIYRPAVRLSLLGAVVGTVLISIGGWWHWQSGEVELGQMLLVTAMFFPLMGGLMLWREAAIGAEDYWWFLVFEGGSNAARGLAIIASAYLFPGMLLPVVLAALAAPAITNVIATLVRIGGTPGSGQIEVGAIRYGLEVSAYQLPTVISQNLDKIFLFHLISPQALAIYVVAQRIPELARALVGDTNATLGPLFARAHGYTAGMQAFSLRLWSVYLAVSAFGALVVVPFALPLLAGDGYADAVVLSQIMTAGIALEYLGNIQFRFVKSQMDSKSFLNITLLTSIMGIALIVALGLLWGLWGVVAAYVLKGACYSLITNHVVQKLMPENRA